MTRLPPYARLALLAAIWGNSFLFIKVALEGLPPLGIALARCAAGALALGGYALFRRPAWPREPVVWAHVAVISFTSNALPFALFAWGELHVTSGVAGVYNATTPLATLAVSMAALPDEHPTRARVAGILLGLLGVVTVIGPWRGVGANSVLGQLACLGAGAAYGVAFTYTRRHLSPRRLDPVAVTVGQLAIASVLLAVAVPFAGGRVDLAPRVVAAVLALGALGTGVAYVLYHQLIRDIGATSASMVTFLVPIVAVTLGAVVLGEPVTWNLFAGAVVVVTGVALAEGRLRQASAALYRPRRRRR